MLDPHELYQLTDELPDLGQPVLIQALTGFVDAGNATRLSREHLRSVLDAQPVATFDIDQLLDYRSRRPIMIFEEDHWASYDEPRLELDLLRDDAGTPFLLLSGPEPDLQWERFVAAVIALIERLGVRLTVGLNAIPMAVPHTRPVGVTAHATRRELITGHEPWLQRVQVPGGAGHLLEYRLGEQGHDALGLSARGVGLGLGLGQGSLGLGQRRFIGARVDTIKGIARRNLASFLEQAFDDQAADLGPQFRLGRGNDAAGQA